MSAPIQAQGPSEPPPAPPAPSPTSPDPSAVPAGQKRRRLGGKRVHFRCLPRPPAPVRPLWTAASEEQKQSAHKACSVMLAYWLGKIGKSEAAKDLCVSELRIWQLSQQALAGMAAGLLKQPRTRQVSALPKDPESDPAALRKKIAALTKELASASRLIELLKELPAHRTSAPASTPGTGEGTHETAGRRRSIAVRRGRKARAHRPGLEEPNREPPPKPEAMQG
jgi:hypothetical protein